MDKHDTRHTSVDVRDFINATPVSRFQIMISAMCFLIVALDGFDIAIIGFIAPHIRAEWQLSMVSLGPLFSAGLLGLMVGAFCSGPMADRIGRRRVLMLSVAWFGAASVGAAFAPNVGWLIALRFLTGLGLGGAMPNAITLTSEFSPERRRGTLLTLMFCGFSLGSALGGVVTAYLVAGIGWRGLLAVGGLLPLALVPVLWFTLPESVRFLAIRGDTQTQIAAILARVAPGRVVAGQQYTAADDRLPSSPVVQLFHRDYRRGTLLLWLAFFMSLLLLYLLINWLPILAERSGLTLKQASMFAGLLQGGGVLGAIVLGVLIDRFHPYKVVAAAYVLGALALASLAIANGAVWLALGIFVTGFCVSGSQVCANVIASAYYPTSNRATGVAWALGIGRIGAVAGSFGGAMLLAAGWSNAGLFTILAIPALLAALGILLAGARQGRTARSEVVAAQSPASLSKI
ncbi:MFS transporter [Pandoraea apista]|uniref:4-hydroxybenzoate transporter n=1 Tax=Pandoraea apista TaxID=93218 RepID=A0A5E5PAP6_9BURK|nr:MFS transporter [Pandoraea apista]OXS93866.1 aromatic acid/H+ symport family MFS transporter [Pandoraea apista]PTE01268.1 MFS transporter [Pandoraea apista]RRJ34406.1 MFS transporter [Pandoraea apista]RRJ81449.1 MFS transporter [Pandoraea apista]RSD16674.1 MFS transporter [Pandoraea apista]